MAYVLLDLTINYLFLIILMHFYDCLHKVLCYPTRCDVTNDVKHFQQYITLLTFTNFLRYPIRCCVTLARALEFLIIQQDLGSVPFTSSLQMELKSF